MLGPEMSLGVVATRTKGVVPKKDTFFFEDARQDEKHVLDLLER